MGHYNAVKSPVNGAAPSVRADWKEVFSRLDLRAEYAAMGIKFTGRINSKGWAECHAIDREDSNPSAGVNLDTGYYHSFSGGDEKGISFWDFAVKHGGIGTNFESAVQHFAAKSGMTDSGPRGVFPATKAAKPKQEKKTYPTIDKAIESRIYAEKKYNNKEYKLGDIAWYSDSFAIVRYNESNGSKTFTPYSKSKAGWKSEDPPGLLPLYRKDELVAADQVVVVEGEKCVNIAHQIGLAATTTAHGAKSADRSDLSPLAGKDLVLIPDNDKPGESYVAKVIEHVRKLPTPPKSIKIVRLPLENEGDDLEQFLERFAGDMTAAREEIERLIGEAVEAPRIAPTPDEDPDEVWEANRVVPLEADDDPHRLQALFMDKHFTRDDSPTLVHYKGDYYRHVEAGTHYEPYVDLIPDLVGVVKDEFNRLNVEALQRIKDAAAAEGTQYKDIDKGKLPKAKQVTNEKVRQVELALRSETLLSSSYNYPCWTGNSRETLPDPVNLLVAQNGILDLTTKKLLRHTPLYFNPYPALPYAYDPHAPKPDRWHRFLREIFPDDPVVWRELQKWFGYLLTPDTRQQKIMLMVGPTRSGKGTIARLLPKLLGEHNVTNPTMGLLATNFGLATLINKTVAIIGDARFGGSPTETAIVTERLLGISGEDDFSVDRKYKESIKTRIIARIIISTNHTPNLRDESSALAERFRPFHMKKSFLGYEDINLDADLAKEVGGILNWAIEGRDMLKDDGKFLVPDSSKDLMNSVREMTSPIKEFIEDCCSTEEAVINHIGKADIELPSRESLFKAYVVWCEDTNRKATSDAVFSKSLRAACSDISDCRPTDPNDKDAPRIRRLRGIDLNAKGRENFYKYKQKRREGDSY